MTQRKADSLRGQGKAVWFSVANRSSPILAVCLAGGIGLAGGSAHAAELMCEVIGTQYAEWRENDYQLSQSKAYRRVHKLALVTGEQPKIGYLSKPQTDWVWEDLKAVPSKSGMLYSAVLSAGGILTAILNDAETRVVVNYTGRSPGSGGEGAIYSTSGIGQCFAR